MLIWFHPLIKEYPVQPALCLSCSVMLTLGPGGLDERLSEDRLQPRG